MDVVAPKNDYEEAKRGLADEVLRRKNSEQIDVIIKGVPRKISLASYFTCRKDPRLDVHLPNGQKPLEEPKNGMEK